jgi:high-affinity nickel-transport protein
LLTLLAIGFFLGVRHATDADHVVAIAAIVTRERRLSGAAAVGVLWGVGHGLTVAVVGCAIILFGVVIPPRVGLAMEFAVGIMLVVLGLFTLAAVARQAREALALHLLHGNHDGADAAERLVQTTGHMHVHSHGDYIHTHEHGHGGEGHGHPEHATPQAWLDRHFGRLTLYQALRPVIVGVVHGLAGSAAIGLLALTAVRDPFWGLVYLLVFGVGTIVGMMLITLLIAAPFVVGANRLPLVSGSVRAFAGALSLGFGLLLMYQIGVVGGLFGSVSH